MTFMPSTFPRRSEPGIDRRRHKRVAVVMLGRFMRANRREHPCRLQDISVGGAAIIAQAAPDPGERIIAHFDQLGGLEGTVCRLLDGGFAMTFGLTRHTREKLAARLTWIANRDAMSGLDVRRHERTIPSEPLTNLQLDDGISIACTILNISLSGAAIAVTARPPIGHHVLLGRVKARVVRHHPDGIGLEFLAEPGRRGGEGARLASPR